MTEIQLHASAFTLSMPVDEAMNVAEQLLEAVASLPETETEEGTSE